MLSAKLLIVPLVIFGLGCGPSAAIQRLVEVECAAHDADLAEWDTLTPEQRKGSVQESRKSWYTLKRAF